MLQRVEAERIFQKIIQQYDRKQKEVLYQELVRKFNLNIQNRLQEQIETLLERKLTPAESEKVTTLSFLKHHAITRTDRSLFRIAAIALIFIVVFQLIIHDPVYNLSQETTSTPPMKLTLPATMPINTPTATLIITPIAQIKTPQPTDIHVGPWHNEPPSCESEQFVTKKYITGVEIYGGTPPYKITFLQYDRIIISYVEGKIEFTTPVEVDKGVYVPVTISFSKANKEFIWTGDLFYKQIDPECQP